MIKILIVDDRAAVREGLKMTLSLESDMMVIGEAEDGKHALEVVSQLLPDLVILDVEMPIMDGLETAKEIHIQYPHIAIIMLSIYEYSQEFFPSYMHGMIAFVEKQGDAKILKEKIRQIYSQTNQRGE
jgi:YesN/AraC family two-component response regulator